MNLDNKLLNKLFQLKKKLKLFEILYENLQIKISRKKIWKIKIITDYLPKSFKTKISGTNSEKEKQNIKLTINKNVCKQILKTA